MAALQGTAGRSRRPSRPARSSTTRRTSTTRAGACSTSTATTPAWTATPPTRSRPSGARGSVDLAHVPCPVPDPLAQSLVLLLHAARTPRGTSSTPTSHPTGPTAPPRSATGIRALAAETGATVALAAATGTIDEYAGTPEAALWEVFAHGGDRLDEWGARLRAARGPRAKASVAAPRARGQPLLPGPAPRAPAVAPRGRRGVLPQVRRGRAGARRPGGAPMSGSVGGCGPGVPPTTGWVRTDGIVYAACLPDGPPLVLAGPGAVVWDAVVVGGGLDEVVDRVADAAGESVAAVRPGVESFVAGLVDAGVVVLGGTPGRREPSSAPRTARRRCTRRRGGWAPGPATGTPARARRDAQRDEHEDDRGRTTVQHRDPDPRTTGTNTTTLRAAA